MPISPADIRTYLAHAPYPAAKDELLRAAVRAGADANMLEIIATLDDREYADADDAVNELAGVSLL